VYTQPVHHPRAGSANGVIRNSCPVTRTISLLLACSLLAPAVAHALPKPPPVKDGVACHLDLKKTYRVAKVARAGLPLDVTCDGAGTRCAS